jgi:hypothetical protein
VSREKGTRNQRVFEGFRVRRGGTPVALEVGVAGKAKRTQSGTTNNHTTCETRHKGETIMSETLTMSRGQLHDLLARFAVENPKYREALIKDPKMVLEKQLGHNLGKLTVKSVIETPDTMYVVVPYVAKEGELSDSDLENVAGGLLDNLNATCNISGGLNLLSSNVAIELG